jgi:large subunit ribosomal protein L9
MPRKNRIKAVPGTRRHITELLLAENVANLGEQGQIVRVRSGYARNFLIPQGLATIATDNNKRMVEVHKKRQDSARKDQIKSWRDLANTVSKYSVTIEANANADGHLYGSILGADISKQLQNAGFAVSEKNVKLEGPLKETGMYTVKVTFAADISTEVKVWVVPRANVGDAK